VNGAHTELLVVASPIIERGKGEVIKDKVAIERKAVEPELVTEAYSGHISPRRWRRSSSLQHLVSRRCRHFPLPISELISHFFSFTTLAAPNSFRKKLWLVRDGEKYKSIVPTSQIQTPTTHQMQTRKTIKNTPKCSPLTVPTLNPNPGNTK